MTERHLLFVDDSTAVLATVRRHFERIYQVHTAESAAKGHALLEKYPIDIVLSDQRMPGSHGSEFLEKIAKTRPDTVRWIVTGFCEDEALLEAVKGGEIHRVFRKPLDIEELRLALQGAFVAIDSERDRRRLAEELEAKASELSRRLAELREEKERRLAEEERFFRLIEHSPNAIVLADKEGRILRANQTRARKAAEAANVAKSAFLASMSHEVRTPLNAILGFAQLLEQNESLPSEARTQAGLLLRSGRHLLSLINDVLEMSRIDARHVQLNPTPIHLAGTLARAAERLTVRAQNKGLEISCHVADALPARVTADEQKLQSVLNSLLDNAVKFTQEGKVTISAMAAASEAGPRLLLEIADTGPGIEHADLELIFERFGQTRLGRDAGGAGLGLPISRELANLMRGDLTVRSHVGQGSVFRLDLPLEAASWSDADLDRTERRPVVGLAQGQRAFRVLIVDDDDDCRRVLDDTFRPLGFETQEASGGESAVEIAAKWRPQLILMDRRMPGTDGVEATRRIKALPDGEQIAIVMISASSTDADQQQAIEAGAASFVAKPFNRDELLHCAADVLGARYTYVDSDASGDASPPSTPITDASTEQARQSLAEVPKALRAQMYELVTRGDLDDFSDLVAQIEDQLPEIAEGLRALARDYESERLLELLEAQEDG